MPVGSDPLVGCLQKTADGRLVPLGAVGSFDAAQVQLGGDGRHRQPVASVAVDDRHHLVARNAAAFAALMARPRTPASSTVGTVAQLGASRLERRQRRLGALAEAHPALPRRAHRQGVRERAGEGTTAIRATILRHTTGSTRAARLFVSRRPAN